MRRPRRLSAIDAMALLVVALTAVLYTREIGNAFLWGHDGGNGAPYWHAAGNSLRFHVLAQAKDYTRLAPPSAADFYTHHPLLLHYHLIVVRALFGASEWVGRLVPFVYSVLTLPLLYGVARAHYGRAIALAALVVYALTPLQLIFATMIGHEQGGIFWTLLACHAALRWQRFAKRRDLVLLGLASTLAMQFAWASYFVLASAGIFGALAWRRSPAGGVPARRARSLVVALALLGIANFGAFFVAIFATKGSFGDMQAALLHRVGAVEGYAESMLQRALDLYGAIVLGLTAAGLARLVQRLRDGRWRTRDMLPVSFLVGQLGLSLTFRNAGRIHAFWTYYAGVACALLAADAIVSMSRRLAKKLGKRILVAILAVTFALQTTIAFRQQSWGLATGHAAYPQNPRAFDDMFEEVQLAKWLNARYGRSVTYVLSSSFHARTEVFCYLDAPHVGGEPTDVSSSTCHQTRDCVFVADLRRVNDGAALSLLSRYASEHPTALFAGHLLTVELSSSRRESHAYRLTRTAPNRAHAWFVSARHGPASWVEVDGAKELLTSSLDLEVPDYVTESSKAGVPIGEPCPRGVPLTGFAARRTEGMLVSMRGLCGHGDRRTETRAMAAGPTTSADDGVESACPANEAVVGLALAGADDLSTVQLLCAPASAGAPATLPTTRGKYVLACPARTRAISLLARARGRRLSGLGIGCGKP